MPRPRHHVPHFKKSVFEILMDWMDPASNSLLIVPFVLSYSRGVERSFRYTYNDKTLEKDNVAQLNSREDYGKYFANVHQAFIKSINDQSAQGTSWTEIKKGLVSPEYRCVSFDINTINEFTGNLLRSHQKKRTLNQQVLEDKDGNLVVTPYQEIYVIVPDNFQSYMKVLINALGTWHADEIVKPMVCAMRVPASPAAASWYAWQTGMMSDEIQRQKHEIKYATMNLFKDLESFPGRACFSCAGGLPLLDDIGNFSLEDMDAKYVICATCRATDDWSNGVSQWGSKPLAMQNFPARRAAMVIRPELVFEKPEPVQLTFDMLMPPEGMTVAEYDQFELDNMYKADQRYLESEAIRHSRLAITAHEWGLTGLVRHHARAAYHAAYRSRLGNYQIFQREYKPVVSASEGKKQNQEHVYGKPEIVARVEPEYILEQDLGSAGATLRPRRLFLDENGKQYYISSDPIQIQKELSKITGETIELCYTPRTHRIYTGVSKLFSIIGNVVAVTGKRSSKAPLASVAKAARTNSNRLIHSSLFVTKEEEEEPTGERVVVESRLEDLPVVVLDTPHLVTSSINIELERLSSAPEIEIIEEAVKAAEEVISE